MSDINEFLTKIQPLDIYSNLDLDKFPLDSDVQGWCGHQHILQKYVALAKPELVIEVGTWKGLSAIAMASKLKELGLNDSRVLCIDTWLGASEHWNDMFSNLAQYMEHGLPLGLYYQFLANVIKSDLADYIVPLPSTSRSAAEILTLNNIKSNLIYIDASHIYDEVLSDCNNYSDIVNVGGYLIFDDYSDTWPGVKNAIDDFLKSNSDFNIVEIYGPCVVVNKIRS